jgi:molybdate transport system substrate-binding protein
MKFPQFISGIAALLALLSGAVHADDSPPLTVFAAASTAGALQEIAALYEAQGHGAVRCVFASSGVLARQIDNGAPADLYLSASSAWMDWLTGRGGIQGEPVILFGNRLVLIQPADAMPLALDETLPAALAGQRLAMGDPDHVPAGIYARQALTRLELWDPLSPLAVRMKDVRAALLLVQRGEAAAGIVYASDALGDERLQVAATFPGDSHDPILYSAAILKNGNRDAAHRILEFLRGPAGSEVFRRHGFRLE